MPKIPFATYQKELLEILRGLNGHYISPYQVCKELELKYSQIWQALLDAYPMPAGNPPMGKKAGRPYSPASHVSHAYDHYMNNLRISEIRTVTFDTKHSGFAGIEPGASDAINLWAWRS